MKSTKKVATLTAADRDRLAKLLGMTGSAHDGEALNAARMADQLVRQRGITWNDVITAGEAERASDPRDILRDWPAHWQAAAAFVAVHGYGVIRGKDIDFATKVSTYTHRPTEPQLTWLRDITERVLAAGGVR